jgi:hypothetical protein
MTAQGDDPDGVGYRRSPKSGQFKKGQSGNPRGRPKKTAKPKPELPAAQHPYRTAFRAEAARKITITDANGQQEIVTREAILRALSLNALRGGVLAQRTWLTEAAKEDERYHRECKERFDYWYGCQVRKRDAIEAAVAAGKKAPEFLPHPDDIVLDWETLEVRILGAVDEEGLARQRRIEARQDLAYEMYTFTEEALHMADEAGRYTRIGLYLLLYLSSNAALPPRLRRPPVAYEETFWSMMIRGKRAWGQDLERRCGEAEFPFIRPPPGRPPLMVPIPKGLVPSTIVAGGIVMPRSRRKRR